MSSRDARVAIGSTVFALVACALLYALPRQPITPGLLRGEFRQGMGKSWVRSVKYPDELAGARLFEDDLELGPANQTTLEVVEGGGGRFRLYRDPIDYLAPILVFSTSDGSNPNTNGRKYRLLGPEPAPAEADQAAERSALVR
ncbi:hypothetical protein [Bradyrhizobium sp. 27S5]|uniref:hypothetical protein n=1 Tax=Bradyrhizobium sp. 27S5 TaxID=3139728 RepID=UPI0030CA9D3F